MSASYTPYVVIAALIAVAHATTVEEHDPCTTGTANIGSRRPVEERLHIGKGMAARQGRVTLCCIYQACQLLNRGKPPPFSTTHRFIIGIGNSISPNSRRCIRGFFPDKPRLPIKYGLTTKYRLEPC